MPAPAGVPGCLLLPASFASCCCACCCDVRRRRGESCEACCEDSAAAAAAPSVDRQCCREPAAWRCAAAACSSCSNCCAAAVRLLKVCRRIMELASGEPAQGQQRGPYTQHAASQPRRQQHTASGDRCSKARVGPARISPDGTSTHHLHTRCTGCSSAAVHKPATSYEAHTLSNKLLQTHISSVLCAASHPGLAWRQTR